MKKPIMILVLILMLPIANACTIPKVYNEYGVPVNLIGAGSLPIYGENYPLDQQLILYNFTVENLENQEITITFSPSGSLWAYVYEASATVGPLQTKNLSLPVYVDGKSKIGELYTSGLCEDGLPMVEGLMNIRIYGRNNQDPQSCSNTKTSCGIFPNCQDLSELEGCYDGKYRIYSCTANSPTYTDTCNTYCCHQFKGPDASCQPIGGHSTCVGPDDYCENECDVLGSYCQGNDLYSCVEGEDGCYDLVFEQSCDMCYQGQCIDDSGFTGKIAFVCRDDSCDDGLEPNLISWLDTNNWLVIGKGFDSWTDLELDYYDLMMCSDETEACKQSSGIIYDEHTNENMPFVEIGDYRNVHQAYRFGYIKNPYNYLATSDQIHVTADNAITDPYDSDIKIFNSKKKMAIVPDYRLESFVEDVADVGSDNGKSTLFKVEDQTRYIYVGWFYKASFSDLTQYGSQVLNRTIVWALCGDECLVDPNQNKPPVAVSSINPYPIAYESQTIQFDASQSYDPEGQALKYYWDFGDQTNSGWISQASIEHVYNVQGDYVISLIVNDGELNSEPDEKTLSILPTIKDKIAFLCSKDSCSIQPEQELKAWLEDQGYYVDGKSKSSWTESELESYDLMICSSTSGCSVKSWMPAYKKHANGKMPFIEIPDYQYLKAGYKFGYISWWSGFKLTNNQMKIAGADQITSPFSNNIHVFSSDQTMAGIFNSRLGLQSVSLTEMTDKDVCTQFKVDASGNSGRYVYVGWFYKSEISDLTENGEELLLRTLRWIQCGDADGC